MSWTRRFVYLLVSVMFLATVLPGPAPAQTTERLSSLSAGDTVTFGGYTWIVLNPDTGYLMLANNFRNPYNSESSFDWTPNCNVFSLALISNTLNGTDPSDFYGSLPPAARALIKDHGWDLTPVDTSGAARGVLPVSANYHNKYIGLLSYNDWKTYSTAYNPTSGFLANPSPNMWTLTPVYGSSTNVWAVDSGGSLFQAQAYGANGIRPALYLDSGILLSGGTVLDQQPASAPFNTPPTAAPGASIGTTAITVSTNNSGDTVVVKVYGGPMAVPINADPCPVGPGVTANYTSGADLAAVAGDYVGVYEVDATGGVVAFSQIGPLTAGQISPLAPALNTPPTAAPGSSRGTTAITVSPNNSGDTLAVEVSTTSIPTPDIGDPAPSGPGVTANYTPGTNLAAAAGDYVGVFELNAGGTVEAFSQIQLTPTAVAAHDSAASGSLYALQAGDTVTFAGQTWIVLDPHTGYLLMQGQYGGYRAFDSSGNSIFTPNDPGDSTNIGWYLNNDPGGFYQSLSPADQALIQLHNWTTGNEANESSASVDAKIGLLSISECSEYGNNLGNLSDSSWTRTPCSGIANSVWTVYAIGSMWSNLLGSTYPFMVRPVLYLNPDILVSGGQVTYTLGPPAAPTYAVTYEANGATGTPPDTVNYPSGADVTVAGAGTLSKSGYTFGGWEDVTGHVYQPDDTFTMPASAVVLKAVWNDSAKSISVGSQSGSITAGTAGSATFTATTANIPDGAAVTVSWCDAGGNATSAPAGLSASGTNVSSNGSTITVTAGTTAAAGTYYFTATSDGVTSDVVTVTVSTAVPVSGISLNKTADTLTAGGYDQLTAAINPSNSTNQAVTWASGNTGVATVNQSGLVIAVAAGTANITVTTSDGGKTATCAVTVNAASSNSVTVSPNSSTITVNNSPVQVNVPSDVANAALKTTATVSAGSATATLPRVDTISNTSQGGVNVSFSDGTQVTGPPGWDGTINLPQVVSATVNISGYNTTVGQAVEIGLGNTPLTFSQPVRLLLAGQGGKNAGWIRNGIFTPITYQMAADSSAALNGNADGYITVNNGSDMAIWTTHFTTFVAYTQSLISSGGGGSSSTPALALTTTSLSAGIVGQPYSRTITTNDKGTAPYTFTVTGGSLPSGLTLDASAGVISGTPTAAGTYTFTVTVKDKNNNSANESYTMTVNTANTTQPSTQPVTLSDIVRNWAQDNIEKLVSLGAITGYPDGTFRPDNDITRAEFVTVLVKAFKLEPKQGKVFVDTANCWARDYISTAAAYDIVSGYNDSHLGPDDSITREQMAAMVVKAAKLLSVNEQSSFTDSADISAWAKEAVSTSVKYGIIKGYPDNSLRPGGNATRAEAVTVIVNALNK